MCDWQFYRVADWPGPVLSTEAVLNEATHLLAGVQRGRAACVDFFLSGGQARPASFPITLATNPLRAAGSPKRARMRVRPPPRRRHCLRPSTCRCSGPDIEGCDLVAVALDRRPASLASTANAGFVWAKSRAARVSVLPRLEATEEPQNAPKVLRGHRIRTGRRVGHTRGHTGDSSPGVRPELRP